MLSDRAAVYRTSAYCIF